MGHGLKKQQKTVTSYPSSSYLLSINDIIEMMLLSRVQSPTSFLWRKNIMNENPL